MSQSEPSIDSLANAPEPAPSRDASRLPNRETSWAADLPGFGLRRYSSGRRVYVVQTAMGGRLRTVTLGPASVLTESEARKLARHVLLRGQTGGNPAEDRKQVRAAPAFKDFLGEYWQRSEPSWKPSTQRTHGVYRRLYLDDAFAGQYVDHISQADVLDWFRRTTERAGPGGANRVMTILNALFARAEDWGYRREGDNPCRGIRPNRPRKMERFLSSAELKQLGETLTEERARFPVHTAAVLLILLTGCRSSEVLGLRWSDVKGSRLHLRDSKTGPRTVWISEEGRSVLAGLKRRHGVEDVFYNPVTGRRIAKLVNFWERIRERRGFASLRLHDLRHTYASHAAAGSETLPMIGKLLGHRRINSTSRYTHLDDHNVLAAAEEIDRTIAMLIGLGNEADLN